MSNCEDFMIWMTLFETEFDNRAYLYHYTSFESACRILYGDSLKFSSLSRTNDTIEAKPKIQIKKGEDKKNLKILLERFEKMNKSKLRLLCFSKDSQPSIQDDRNYDDYSGRGFALPRMWAQYGDNHKGVCFIIDKKKLDKTINQNRILSTEIIKSADVIYKSTFGSYVISNEEIDVMLEILDKNRSYMEHSFLKNASSFISYNYFQKNSDWSQENEYRILAYCEEEEYLKDFSEYCVGIVVGEMLGEVEMKIINCLSERFCPIKKIKFNYGECILENIKYKGFDIYA